MDGKDYFDFMIELMSHKYFTNKELTIISSFFWENLNDQYKNRWKNKSKILKSNNIKVAPFWLFANKIKSCLVFKDLTYFEFIWPEITTDVKTLWGKLEKLTKP